MVGQTVSFFEYTRNGLTLLRGVVQSEFREPPCEDPYERLNYVVRTPTGEVFTPYAADCRPVK
jgi:hypothetical protein